MKKVSAFSIFKSKKDDTPKLERENKTRGSMKKASSSQSLSTDDKKTNGLIKTLKGGSFRRTLRGNKHRPTIVTDGNWNSPFVAGDSDNVKLTSLKDTPTLTGPKSSTVNGIEPKKPKEDTSKATPSTKRKDLSKPGSVSEKTNPKENKPLPPLPVNGIQETPKNANKRQLEQSPNESQSKRKRKTSPQKAEAKILPVQHVNPQKKEKNSQKKVWQGVTLQHMFDSQEEAAKLFECMIHPVPVEKFFKELWEKKSLLVRRHDENYNDGWFSTAEFDRILKEEHLEFGVNLDVTSYKDGKRETHNPVGKAYRPVIWDYYNTGCSIRLLNPQTFSKGTWKMLSVIQEYFGCCVGANVYLTPPGTQGFAPHYDDIEAFILQLEGKKHWKVYNPRNDAETLPRFSSGNFTDADIGTSILDVTLDAGDMLYLPRGTIHQANALEDTHSLHITFSCYQKNTWGDLLETLIPRALEIAIEEDVEFRQGLPLNFLNYMGLVNSDIESTKRDTFIQKISSLTTKLVQDYLPIDAVCDQLGKRFIHDSLPPVLNEGEKSCSIHGHGEHWDPALKCVKGTTEIEPDTMVKLIRKGAIRLVTESDEVRVYHSLENSRVYHGKDPQYIDITPEMAPAVEHLVHHYPDYVSVDSLPPLTTEERVEIASLLYDKGLLVTGEPLDAMYEVGEESETET